MELKKLNAIWMVVLIVTLPIYSSTALAASVRITGNQGTAGINGFINANSDTWRVEATISDAQSVTPENVILNVGSLSESFDACSAGVSGTVCSYESNLENGVREGDYNFNVNFQGVSQASVVKADGSGPVISGTSVSQQTDGTIDLSFITRDSGDGIASVEILDEQSNVLQTLSVTAGQNELIFSGDLVGISSGEGIRVIRVKATDRLGHETISGGVSFRTDFIAPVVEKVNITLVDRFIGVTAFSSDVVVDVRENSEFREQMIRMSSSSSNSLQNTNPNSCLRDDDEFDLWHCTFGNVIISPSESVSFDIYTEDRFGNSATVSRSVSFTRDSSPPTVDFFGSERVYDGQSYVNNVNNRIVLRFSEVGAGIDKSGVRANLAGIGGSSSEAPDYFNESAGEAFWDVGSGTGGARITLVKLQDRAGNEDPTQLVETGLVVDNTGPRIERMEFYGVSDQNEHAFFQSQDQLKLEFTAREDSGLEVLVNIKDLVDNAELKYPKRGSDIPSGWISLTHDDGCSRVEGVWECNILVPELLRSGTGRNVDLEIVIRDTAGNSAVDFGVEPRNVERVVRNGKYKISLLGLSEEEDPNFWTVSPVNLKPDFVDLDTVELAPTRVQANVNLRTAELQAQMLSVSLGRCEVVGDAPTLKNSLFYGGIEPGGESSPKVGIVLEFDTFDGRTHFNVGADSRFDFGEAEYNCQLEIFSKIGRNALRVSEIQDVPITVKFGFTSNGAIDEGLAQKVTELKENDLFKIASALSFLSTGVRILNFAGQLFQIVYSANILFDIFSTSAQVQAESWRLGDGLTLGGTEAIITALKGGCYSVQAGGGTMWEFVNVLQIPMNILSCNPGVSDGKGGTDWGLGWYGWWQRGVLDVYNIASGRGPLGVPASSLQENLIASAIGLCIPGLILNMEKTRELHCRKIVCYAQDVPAGVATTEACDSLYDLQLCEFVVGTFFDFFLLGGIAEIGKSIQSIFTSPIGAALLPISIAQVAACWNLCWTDVTPGNVQACKALTGVNKALAIVDNIVGAVQTAGPSVGTQYCGQVGDIDVGTLTGGQFIPSNEKSTETSEEVPERDRVAENRGRDTPSQLPGIGERQGTPNVQPQTNN
jgi:hypothetical protein